MLYEIINPHDPYTIAAESLAAALGAVAILGEGRYGLQPIGHDGPKIPLAAIFGDWPESLYEDAGIFPRCAAGLMAWIDRNYSAVAGALDSVRYGTVEDRDVPREIGRNRRSSTADLCNWSWNYAEALRRKRAFGPIDAEAGNGE